MIGIARPAVREINLKVKESTSKYLLVYDAGGLLAIKVVKGKDRIKLTIGVKGYNQPLKIENKQLSEGYLRKVLKDSKIELLEAHAEELTKALWGIIKPWLEGDLGDALDVMELLEERPLYQVEAGEGLTVVVSAADGVEIPIHGGFVEVGRYKVVVETTYAHIRKTVTTKDGIKEVESIDPIAYYAVYETRDGSLILTKRGAVHPTSVKKIVVGDRPIKFVAQSVAGFELPTMANAKSEMKAFLEGAEGPSFSELKDEILSNLRRFINFEWDPRYYSLVAAYVVYTYIYDMFSTAPRLFFLGPYGSGKTRAMLTTIYMSRHGWVVLDPSDASSFRGIEALGPTIGVDEAALSNRLLKILSAGYKRGLSVPRVEKTAKERFMLGLFKTFSPVVFAFTEPPAELLSQRAIFITMKKTRDPAGKDPEPYEFEELRGKLYLARLTRLPEVLEAKRKVREDVTRGVEVNGKALVLEARDYEIWYPVLVGAYLLGEDVYKEVLELASEDVDARKASLWSEEKAILAALERLLGDSEEVVVRTSEIQEELKLLKQEEMGDAFDDRDFKKRWSIEKIGRIMRRLGWRRKTTRKLPGTPKAYTITLKEFCDVAERYGYESEKCGRCGHFSGKGQEKTEPTALKENSQENTESSGKSNDVVTSDSDTTLSKKVTTPTTVTTSRVDCGHIENVRKEPTTSEENLRRIFETVEEAVWESLALSSPKSAYEIYEELKEWRKEGKLRAPVTWERVAKALERLEGKEVVYRFMDPNYQEERFTLHKLPPWW